jgi:hypothetical protein
MNKQVHDFHRNHTGEKLCQSTLPKPRISIQTLIFEGRRRAKV